MRRLKYAEVAEVRHQLGAIQGWRCALCRLKLNEEDAVLDHDHGTGVVREVLHRGCNALLGKIENNHKRYGVPVVSAFLHGAADYLQRHAHPPRGAEVLLHPTHKTPDEKRLARNKAARARRARKV